MKEDLSLIRDDDGLFLTDGRLVLRGDFTEMSNRLKRGNLQQELLVKAARLKRDKKDPPEKRPLVIDATAGMGEDSFLLAAAGYEVWLYEYDPVIAALLEDALQRALAVPELSEAAGRMRLFKENSIEALKRLPVSPDVVYLDPMFPERQKSALVKKKFQLLQQLESPCCNEEELLKAAITASPRKLVIKRPLKGPYLGGIKPDYSLTGKAIRYDCFTFPLCSILDK